MKSLKKIVREQRLKTHNLLRSWLQPKLGHLGTKLRLAARIRLANRVAGKHPKQTFGCVVGLLLVALAGNIAFTSLYAGNNNDKPDVNTIANMDPVFSGFHTIQANKDVQRNTLQQLADEGVVIKKDLDSLIRIPVKTHADSIQIIRQYNRLETIVKSLKNQR